MSEAWPNPPKCTCPPWRKRLATFALVLLVVAGRWATARIVRVNSAIANLKASGGNVVVACSPNFRGSTALELVLAADWRQQDEGQSVWLTRCRRRSELAQHTWQCSGTTTGQHKDYDAGLQHLKGRTGLVSLSLENTGVTDAGIAELAGLSNLQSLNLSNTHVGNAAMEHVGGMAKLETLGLANTRVTDAGAKGSVRLPNS